MMNNLIKCIVIIIFTFLATSGLAQKMSEMVNTELQQVDVANSTVTVNGKRYKYEPNKKESMFRESKLESLTLRSLFKGNTYYFEVQQDFSCKSARSNRPEKVIFISEEKLPE